ncbi:HNH endonuclease signature motif containing protein [Nocardia otitidiscaviarum]|uniref:HNH endonuclease signature motif containing protein n=1 Tax=Nocardia otitidiscaviarum TaxID=1823 RepID=UPI002458DB8F|nr:HNH endonuclease signature motif containing protein [Nocardia otitidiscaviarum]
MNGGGEIQERGIARELVAVATAALNCDLSRMNDDDFVEWMREVETARRLLDALSHRAVIETSDRSLGERAGVAGTREFLIETLRISRADANSRYRMAEKLGRFHLLAGLDGEVELPNTARAQSDGEISADHARQIMKVMKRIPHAVERTDREAAERVLADTARKVTPDDLPRLGDEILGYLDPDGALSDDRDRARQRELMPGRQRPDGMSPLTGMVDPTLRAFLDMVFAKWGRPGMNNPDDPDSPHTAAGTVDPALIEAAARRDRRSAGQRNHDALTAFLAAGGGPERLGTHRGLPVSVILTMNLGDVERALGIDSIVEPGDAVARTASGTRMSITEALRMAQRSIPTLVVFDHTGMPLHLGGSRRLASPWQRLALIAAERGCTRPGCDAPAVYCAVHHKREHAADGPTDIDNLTLACDPCHARITNTDHGWTTPAPPRIDGVTTTGLPAIGRATWIAPHHVDPTRTPHINHRHHGGELLAHARRQLLADYAQAAEQHRRWLTAADTDPNRSQTPAAANTPGPDTPPRNGPRICVRRPRRGS